jgi:hypothetical protein
MAATRTQAPTSSHDCGDTASIAGAGAGRLPVPPGNVIDATPCGLSAPPLPHTMADVGGTPQPHPSNDACLVCLGCGGVLATLAPAAAARAVSDRSRTAVPLCARIPLLAAMFGREAVAPLRFTDRGLLRETTALVPVSLLPPVSDTLLHQATEVTCGASGNPVPRTPNSAPVHCNVGSPTAMMLTLLGC